MRRVFASLLLAIFGFLAAAPAIFADDASDLPACCRRFGKHHCSMYDSGAPAFKGVCPSYGQRPGPAVSPVNPGVLAAPQTALAPRPAHPAAIARPLGLLRSFRGASRLTRGPPA